MIELTPFLLDQPVTAFKQAADPPGEGIIIAAGFGLNDVAVIVIGIGHRLVEMIGDRGDPAAPIIGVGQDHAIRGGQGFKQAAGVVAVSGYPHITGAARRRRLRSIAR